MICQKHLQMAFNSNGLKYNVESYKSFLVCNVYRPLSIPTNCLESLAKNLVDSSLLNLDTILLGDLNCNLMGDSLEVNSLKDFISSFNLSQMIGKPTRVTETTQSLIDVVMTSNKSIVCLCDVLTCSISDYNLVYLVLALKIPRRKPYYVTIRSYKNYSGEEFCNDLALAPFHMVSFLTIWKTKLMSSIFYLLMS